MSNIGWSCLHITITEISDLNFTEPTGQQKPIKNKSICENVIMDDIHENNGYLSDSPNEISSIMIVK
jgi:hypothetical protein